MSEKKIIEVRGVSAAYKKSEKFSLQEIQFYLGEGEVLGILGRNGAGKTTLLECISHFMELKSGEVQICGTTWEKDGAVIGETIGYVSRKNTYGITGKLEVTARYWGSFYQNYSHEDFQEYCRRLGLDANHKRLRKLSDGENMLFALALNLAQHPKLLIMDEPFSNLDPISRQDVIGLLREAMDRDNMSIIYSTHMIHELEQIADRILYLDHGKQTFFGDVNEIQDRFFPGRQVDLEELFEIPELNQWKDEEYEMLLELEREALAAGGVKEHD